MNIKFILASIFSSITKRDKIYLAPHERALNLHLMLICERLQHHRKEKRHKYHEIAMEYDETNRDANQRLMECIKLLRNKYHLKVKFIEKDIIRMKVLCGDGIPCYWGKITPNHRDEALISISHLESGDYNIELSNISGKAIVTGVFSIN
ncbi:MAG: hypothetical protein LBV43_09405 [Prevotella sp.]|jgi:hypothetical protein|nr:hypothetical protein [Prevotella sp.]